MTGASLIIRVVKVIGALLVYGFLVKLSARIRALGLRLGLQPPPHGRRPTVEGRRRTSYRTGERLGGARGASSW